MEKIDTLRGAYLVSAIIRALNITRPDGRDIEYRFAILDRQWGGQYIPKQEIIEINESQLVRHPAYVASVFIHECAHLLVHQTPSFVDAYRCKGEAHDPPFFLTNAALLFRASIPPKPQEIVELARAAWRNNDEYLSGLAIMERTWQQLKFYDIFSSARLTHAGEWAPDYALARAAPWISWALSHAESLARDDTLTPAGVAERAIRLFMQQVEINRARKKGTTNIKIRKAS
ncbi:MAG: hypothetical protein M0Z85_12795 [Gammaproteobacteria bacterium]|nr:hypothetical protein [Gammaproteobacteria bacterium]